MNLDEFKAGLLDESNPSAQKFLRMGFTIESAEVLDQDDRCCTMIKFRCACGRLEMLSSVVTKEFLALCVSVPLDSCNAYAMIDSAGALSREHLLSDGYTVAQVDAMERGDYYNPERKVMNVIINGNPYPHLEPFISYEQVMQLLGEDPAREVPMTYCTRPDTPEARPGTMIPGKKIAADEGMTFAVKL